MKKIFSMLIVGMVFIGIVPATAAPEEDVKTKIEKNLADGILYKEVSRKIANSKLANAKEFYAISAKLELEIKTIEGNSKNVLAKFYNGKLYVYTSDTTITGPMTVKEYSLVFDGKTLTGLEEVSTNEITESVDVRLTYGIVRIQNLDGETVNYKGSYSVAGGDKDISVVVTIDPVMSMTLTETEFKHTGITAFDVPIIMSSNLSSVDLKITCESIKNSSGSDLNLSKKISGTLFAALSVHNLAGVSEGDSLLFRNFGNLQRFASIRILTEGITNEDLPVGETIFTYSIVMSAGGTF